MPVANPEASEAPAVPAQAARNLRFAARACDVCRASIAHSDVMLMGRATLEPGKLEASVSWNFDEVRQAMAGCPKPREASRQWFQCSQCPDSDFCAPCVSTHEHACTRGKCHDALSQCRLCAP